MGPVVLVAQLILAGLAGLLVLQVLAAPVGLQALYSSNDIDLADTDLAGMDLADIDLEGMVLADMVSEGMAMAGMALADTDSISTVRNSCHRCTHLYFYRNYSRVSSTLNHF